ncbi:MULTISPECIES: hypothetical protein [unclassified Yoonia]|uniref:hypothetical protein n=1 Tax=unclassified Yoonia TaxID=2629118 RepID=UPI002AFF2A7D|nr:MULTISPECIES: hypothetical protein [unclassified Yoonia]
MNNFKNVVDFTILVKNPSWQEESHFFSKESHVEPVLMLQLIQADKAASPCHRVD